MQIDNNLIKQAWYATEISYFLDKHRTCNGVVNLDVVERIIHENISCFVLQDAFNGNIFITFPGSNDWRDWLKTNIDHDIKDEYHEGFLDACNSVKNEIDQAVAKLANNVEITITGHSLGGALANVYFDLCHINQRVKCITFAQPKISTQPHIYNSECYLRVFTANDPIVLVPFEHDCFRFSEGNSLQLGTKWTFWQRCKRLFNYKVDYAEEHDKAFYRKMIGELK